MNSLKEVRQYPRQPYNELITVLIALFKKVKTGNQYDEFLLRFNSLNEGLVGQ